MRDKDSGFTFLVRSKEGWIDFKRPNFTKIVRRYAREENVVLYYADEDRRGRGVVRNHAGRRLLRRLSFAMLKRFAGRLVHVENAIVKAVVDALIVRRAKSRASDARRSLSMRRTFLLHASRSRRARTSTVDYASRSHRDRVARVRRLERSGARDLIVRVVDFDAVTSSKMLCFEDGACIGASGF